jgi:putative DNA primase/helicase
MDSDDWLLHPSPDELVITHPYSIAKGITHAGGVGRVTASGSIIGKNTDCLIVPIREHGVGEIQAVECISDQPINDKWPKQTFGPKSGGYLLLGNALDKSVPWYVVEGWADAYSTVWHLNNPDGSKRDNCVCAVAFGKTNLDNCAKQILEHHDPDKILVIHDAERPK